MNHKYIAGGGFTMANHISKIEISNSGEKSIPDKASTGALSRWLETDKQRLRVVTYPSGYEADHTCLDGHAFYVASGKVNIKHDDEVSEWSEGDAFIIPDGVPHLVFNPFESDAKVVVVDHG